MTTANGLDVYKLDSSVNTAELIHGNPYGLTGSTSTTSMDLSRMTGMPNYPISGAEVAGELVLILLHVEMSLDPLDLLRTFNAPP